ncbi:hypothetical protein R1sor_007366 [Riccia sorocarpa]|uniref:Uncharacterized protein n=1 Tax=Riccia sorocarpa TaxID=122646 RepID=A0ABD3HTV8_9MARC
MPDHHSKADEMIPRVVIRDVPVTEFENLVANHSDCISSQFGTPYIEWHCRPGSKLGDIIVVENASFYHEWVKERVAKYIEEAELQADVPDDQRLERLGEVVVQSELRGGISNGGFSPQLSQEEVDVLYDTGIHGPRQALVVEVGADRSYSQILDKIENLYRRMEVYLFARDNDFHPIQILDVGNCDEHGQVRARHPDQGAVHLMIPIGALYYGTARPIQEDSLPVHFGRIADDTRRGVARHWI